jgi:hypothetical protein
MVYFFDTGPREKHGVTKIKTYGQKTGSADDPGSSPGANDSIEEDPTTKTQWNNNIEEKSQLSPSAAKDKK